MRPAKLTTKISSYSYATDFTRGRINAASLDAAYDAIRAKITDAMIEDGATLWVEDATGERLTMGTDRE